MHDHEAESGRDGWARLRFAIVGPLLAAPPARGALRAALERLAAQSWRHPSTRTPVSFAFPTIERWYYAARNATRDPVGVLRHRRRKDAGQQRALSARLQLALQAQYHAHRSWSYQLQLDNLAVLIAEDPTLGPAPSYSTLRRYLTAQGLRPAPRAPTPDTPGTTIAVHRREQLEVRSFEAEYVHGLWHLDFHHGSRKVLSRTGAWGRPRLLGVLDDRSRVACHLQWYLDETAETLVHGLAQALQKRGLPRALLTDNGAAMLAAEVRQGLETLGIVHETTLPYSPYQNAKQEVFWAQVEGRLLAMLEGEAELTLERLNAATQAWVELAHHRAVHRELGCAPLARYLAGPDVGRPSPSSEDLRRAFRAEVDRTQRRSDGTVSLEGRRFEVPARSRHLTRLRVRYARWDLGAVDLVDPHTHVILCALYPLDKAANADGRRRRLAPVASTPLDLAPMPSTPAPLLRKLMADYAATGLPPAYLPPPEARPDEEESRS
ncbi:MAG: DDE-type integrase/transposase/recombinase [Candidatus Rokubacteria bacterium]|nr:DDE-type integrase/transposase/recombinase [Candidatus Rokubacteria bacterium]MBI3826925.1 DDE-type integrase/transposase/recombinase [Candidatus Rokubacteria bacterium]